MKVFSYLTHLARHEPAVIVMVFGELLLITFVAISTMNRDYGQAFSLLTLGVGAVFPMRRWVSAHYRKYHGS